MNLECVEKIRKIAASPPVSQAKIKLAEALKGFDDAQQNFIDAEDKLYTLINYDRDVQSVTKAI